MKYKHLNIVLVFCFSFFFANAQDSSKINVSWQHLHKGLAYCETNALVKSIVGDSKLSILKIDPEQFEFTLLSASEHHDTARTAVEWAQEFNLNIVVNAGMYDLNNKLCNKGYMQNFQHQNNPEIVQSYNAMIAFNPKETVCPPYTIFDLQHQPWDSVKTFYNCYAQGMRMLDYNGNALTWNKKNQSCSMLLSAADSDGNVYYIFSRSPYTHNQMIQFLLALPFKLTTAIYLEGGPETSFYVSINNTKIEKQGSYISSSYPIDTNDHFWKLPNVIGIRAK